MSHNSFDALIALVKIEMYERLDIGNKCPEYPITLCFKVEHYEQII